MAAVGSGAGGVADMGGSLREGSVGMGVSALLDELLDDAGHAGAASGKGGGEELPSPSLGLAPPLPQAGAQLSPRATASIRSSSLSLCQVSPRSQQIAELCGEMDSCLASLDKWEADRHTRIQAIHKDLEAQYSLDPRGSASAEDDDLYAEDEEEGTGRHGAHGVSGRGPEESWALRDVDDAEDADEELVGPACLALDRPGRGASSPSLVRSEGASRTSSPSPASRGLRLSALQEAEDAMRLDDEDRLARLRAEVEGLKRKEFEIQQDHLSIDAGTSEIHSGTTLSALCHEADRMLDELGSLDVRTGGAPPPPERRVLLAEASSGAGAVIEGADGEDLGCNAFLEDVKSLEAALASARSQVDSELAELEKLFAERDLELPGATPTTATGLA